MTHEGTTWASRPGALSARIAVTAPSVTVNAMTVTGRRYRRDLWYRVNVSTKQVPDAGRS